MTYNLGWREYILVLDDVWTVDVWSEIRTVFPSNCIGRFVITSRKREVSLLGTNNSAIHLHPLEQDKSWELFSNQHFGMMLTESAHHTQRIWLRNLSRSVKGYLLLLHV